MPRMNAEDPKLIAWSKTETPFLPLPPPGLPLTGWRDPFVIQRGNGRDKEWIILMGAGLQNEGGTTLIYTAKDLTSPWEYSGLLCLGDPSLGAMWECPLLWEITPAPRIGGGGRGAGAVGRGAGFVNIGGGTAAGDAQELAEVEQGFHIFAEAAGMQVCPCVRAGGCVLTPCSWPSWVSRFITDYSIVCVIPAPGVCGASALGFLSTHAER